MLYIESQNKDIDKQIQIQISSHLDIALSICQCRTSFLSYLFLSWNSSKAPHSLPSWVTFMLIYENIDHIMMRLHCSYALVITKSHLWITMFIFIVPYTLLSIIAITVELIWRLTTFSFPVIYINQVYLSPLSEYIRKVIYYDSSLDMLCTVAAAMEQWYIWS